MQSKYKSIILWIVLIVFFTIATAFVHSKRNQMKCAKVEIVINDSLNNIFISKEDVLTHIKKQNIKLLGQSLWNINTDELEKIINSRSAVRNAEVYADDNGALNISVDQREPIMRVISNRGLSYYVDIEGNIMPLSKKYTSHVLVFNGYINDKKLTLRQENVSVGNNPMLADMYKMAKFVYSDVFWRSQIQQVYVDKRGDIELIPRVGAHIIQLGAISGYKYKLKKLRALYDYGFRVKGWNNYRTINLKYSNQVVCTKR